MGPVTPSILSRFGGAEISRSPFRFVRDPCCDLIFVVLERAIVWWECVKVSVPDTSVGNAI
jgi:hypothetical protein